jgi:hypothetical protein
VYNADYFMLKSSTRLCGSLSTLTTTVRVLQCSRFAFLLPRFDFTGTLEVLLEIYATIVTPYCGFLLDLDWKRGLVLGLGWKHVDSKSEMHMGREVRWDGGEIFSF